MASHHTTGGSSTTTKDHSTSVTTSTDVSRRGLRLPTELILHIVSLCAPSHPGAIIPHTDVHARTLLSFMLVSSLTRSLATKLYRVHGTYVDSSSKLGRLLRLISPSSTPDVDSPGAASAPGIISNPKAHMSPSFRSRFGGHFIFGGYGMGGLPGSPMLGQPPPVKPLWALASLYLAPFTPATVDVLAAIGWTRSLLSCCTQTLVRLVLDIPSDLLDGRDDNEAYAIVSGLKRALNVDFPALEEFTLVRPDDDLELFGPQLWLGWPCLKRMALCGRLRQMHRLMFEIETLEVVVLTRAPGLDSGELKDLGGQFHVFRGGPRDGTWKNLKLMLVNVEHEQPADLTPEEMVNPDGIFTVVTHDVPILFHEDDEHQKLCEDHVRRGALSGELWDWDGDVIAKLSPSPGLARVMRGVDVRAELGFGSNMGLL